MTHEGHRSPSGLLQVPTRGEGSDRQQLEGKPCKGKLNSGVFGTG